MQLLKSVRIRRAVLVVAVLVASVVSMVVAPMSAAPAQAAPAGQVDLGVPFSSVVYGTGCRYQLSMPVDSSGIVTFWERKPGYAPIFIGRDRPQGALATTRWVPRRLGNRYVYAVQNGKKSKPTLARVRQGYGSGWACFAL